MVDYDYIFKVVRTLELFFIKENESKLDGSTYNFILFIPVVRGEKQYKYELILSAEKFDSYGLKELITKLMYWLNDNLKKEEANLIQSIIVAHTKSPFARNINLVVPVHDGIKEINNLSIGDTNIEYGILVFSKLLKKLKEGNAVAAELNDSRIINMGVDEIDENLDIHYYTGKGLRELFPINGKKENTPILQDEGKDYLIKNGYYDTINLSNIAQIR